MLAPESFNIFNVHALMGNGCKLALKTDVDRGKSEKTEGAKVKVFQTCLQKFGGNRIIEIPTDPVRPDIHQVAWGRKAGQMAGKATGPDHDGIFFVVVTSKGHPESSLKISGYCYYDILYTFLDSVICDFMFQKKSAHYFFYLHTIRHLLYYLVFS